MPHHKKASNKSTVDHNIFIRRKRNEEADKLRNTDIEIPLEGFPSRKDNRESLRGRRDLTVLPLSNTPLFGIDEQEENDLSSNSNLHESSHNEMQDFNSGAGEARGNIIPSIINPPIFMETQVPTGASNNDRVQIQSNVRLNDVTGRTVSAMDPNMMSIVKEVIVNTQKDMMADIVANLTNTFRETLQLEAAKIVSQVGNNLSQPPHARPATSQPGDESCYRLEYREPRFYQNELHSANDSRPQRPNRDQQPPVINQNGPPPNDQIPPQNNFNIPNYQINNNRTPLDKWGFQFNGTNMSVEDFLFRVECKQMNSNYTWQEVYSNLNSVLSDPVESWYWNFRKNHPRADYNSFKLALSERYPSRDNDIDLWRKLINRRQRPGEAFDDFVDDVEKIYYKIEDRPTIPQLIDLIRGNVTPDISTYIGLARTNSLAGIKHLAREAEKLVDKLNPHKNRIMRKNVQEVSANDCCPNEDDHVFIEAFTPHKRDYKVYQCKRCSQKFRVNEETQEEKRIYGYGCGKEGVIVTNCPTCTENRGSSQ